MTLARSPVIPKTTKTSAVFASVDVGAAAGIAALVTSPSFRAVLQHGPLVDAAAPLGHRLALTSDSYVIRPVR